ncbi:hypothetical protein [Xanthomonas sp. XNM01]|uniref:hypothetical protein n=1 Tax=Xanthomonas sp. XNM01 TaxID=2769289 RepID=UPI00177D604B|nr:hypothetical protein [Xanthomonas sp. XNM01]MBD9370426.1 hypothetical protein [Xanthomonas sp. XNM01]
MSDQIPAEPRPEGATPVPGRRIAFERLRERTDELELLISGLLAFALLTVPSRLFDAWARNDVHVEGALAQGLQFAFTIGVGFSYSLGLAFVVHLAIRGYWVGLVGLKSTFPAGIQWERLPLMGSVARGFYREMVGDLGEVIDRVDRTASILFAMTILIALTIAWSGLLGLLLMIPSTALSLLFDDGDRIAFIAFGVLYVLFMVSSVTMIALDKLVTRRERARRPSPLLARSVRVLLRVLTLVVPQRLIVPVQFTLQSNLGNRGFTAVYLIVLMAALLIGAVHIVNSLRFSMLSRYEVLTTEAVEHGMLSAHYESMRSPDDVMLRYPMITADRIAETHLRLFIPHRPRLDNDLARERCPGLDHGRNTAEGAEAAARASACLAAMWSVSLDGTPVPIDHFVPLERRDLGMRGLVGYIDLEGKAPGRHDLALVWNAASEDSGIQRRREYLIPFWFIPSIAQPSEDHQARQR